MSNKYIAWVLGIVLVLVLGILAWVWRSRENPALAPKTSEEATGIQQTTPAVPESPTPGKENTSASLDDIAKNIGSDASNDQSALDSEVTAETGSLQEGNTTLNDLGTTYDESKY